MQEGIRERRYRGTCGVEERADGSAVISGYAAVFYREDDPGTQFELFPGLVERVDASAFTRAIREGGDARAVLNHSPELLLGRVSAGTLRLSVDSVGLRYEIDPPNTQYARDAVESIKRGDLTGSSFAFDVNAVEMRSEDNQDVRIIKDVELFDVGPVTYPAYDSTSVGMRSTVARNQYEEWLYLQKRKRELEQCRRQHHN